MILLFSLSDKSNTLLIREHKKANPHNAAFTLLTIRKYDVKAEIFTHKYPQSISIIATLSIENVQARKFHAPLPRIIGRQNQPSRAFNNARAGHRDRWLPQFIIRSHRDKRGSKRRARVTHYTPAIVDSASPPGRILLFRAPRVEQGRPAFSIFPYLGHPRGPPHRSRAFSPTVPFHYGPLPATATEVIFEPIVWRDFSAAATQYTATPASKLSANSVLFFFNQEILIFADISMRLAVHTKRRDRM